MDKNIHQHIKKKKIKINSIEKDKVIENNLLHEHSLFFGRCFRV